MVDVNGLVVDDRERGMFRIHRSTMTSGDVLALERERIFNQCWLYLGHESEVEKPGDYRRRLVGGRPLIFVRDSDGEVRALLNACTHRGATICRQDAGNNRLFQCFYHAWTFDTKGQLVTVPDEDGYSPRFDRAERALARPPRLESYRGFVFVSFNPDVVDLVTYLAGARDYLDLIVDEAEEGMRVVRGTNLYAIKANWKLLVENSLDGYHGIPVHQTYFQYLEDLGKAPDEPIHPNFTGGPVDLGNGHAVIRNHATTQSRPIAHWVPLFGEEAKDDIAAIKQRLIERHGEERAYLMANTSRNLLIFPNLVINDISGITIRYMEPMAPDYMHVTAWELAPREETGARLARRLDSYLTFIGPGGFATPDDSEALESCQQGFRAMPELQWSDISRGMARKPEGLDELQMRTFWRTWHARMCERGLPQRITGIECPDLVQQAVAT
jgi:p-cumate 2,3-dioxygenase alpha subunit